MVSIIFWLWLIILEPVCARLLASYSVFYATGACCWRSEHISYIESLLFWYNSDTWIKIKLVSVLNSLLLWSYSRKLCALRWPLLQVWPLREVPHLCSTEWYILVWARFQLKLYTRHFKRDKSFQDVFSNSTLFNITRLLLQESDCVAKLHNVSHIWFACWSRVGFINWTEESCFYDLVNFRSLLIYPPSPLTQCFSLQSFGFLPRQHFSWKYLRQADNLRVSSKLRVWKYVEGSSKTHSNCGCPGKKTKPISFSVESF